MIAFFIPAGVASAQPGGSPLIEYTRFGGGNWGSYNVSGSWNLPQALIDAVPWVDPVTGYQNEYSISTNNQLIENTRLPTGQWVAANITALANGPAVTNTPAPFDDSATVFGSGNIQAVAATSTGGHLIIYTRQPLGGWSFLDVTQSFNGPSVVDDPAPYVDPLTNLLNVYTTTPGSHLVEYTRMQTRWTTSDLTATYTGPSVVNDPAPFTDPLTGFQNVYATTTGGDLVEYTRPNGPGYFGQWITVDLTAAYGGPHIEDHPVPFTDPLVKYTFGLQGGFQNVYVTTTGNHLVEYTRLPPGNWTLVDLTSLYQGAPIASSPAPFVDTVTSGTCPAVLTTTQIAFATTSASHLVEYVRQPLGNWQIIDLTAAYDGAAVPGDPEPFIDPLTCLLNVYATGIG